MATDQPASPRIVSLDQFRGYTVLGMFFVNFVGSFAVIREVLPVFKHHHTYLSYADTIMPHFLFAVGFSYRLTFLRKLAAGETTSAYMRVIRRNFGLFLLAFVVYPLNAQGWQAMSELGTPRYGEVLIQEFKHNLFQTLSHIALTSLWVLPVIASRQMVRFGFAVFSGMAHVGLSYWFNYTWSNTPPNSIDGGPLGFLTWTIPLIAGTLAYDTWMAGSRSSAIGKCLVGGLVLVVIGYGLTCLTLAPSSHPDAQNGISVHVAEPPFVFVDKSPPDNNLFTVSQRSGSISYLVYGAGFSLVIYSLFILLSDVGGLQLGLFRTLGTNALAGYIIHDLISEAVKPYVPKDAPLWYVFSAFAVYFAICYLFLRTLEKQKIFLRL